MVYLLLQRNDCFGRLRTEVKFSLGRRKLPFTVQKEILPANGRRVLGYRFFQFFKKFVHTPPVFIHMNILIPLDSGNQFILFYIRHPLLVDKEKEKYTKRDGDNTKQYTKRFVTAHPISTGLIKTV